MKKKSLNKIYYSFFSYSIIKLVIVQQGDFIIKVSYNLDFSDGIEFETELIKKTKEQLLEYFFHKRTNFDIQILLIGSDFQKKVWNTLIKIPYGETTSYKSIAEKINNPNASRAVGNANNKNPISIIVPCHRVIGIDKKLVGYAGGLEIKKFLLNIEQ